jgi:hypothetical protein
MNRCKTAIPFFLVLVICTVLLSACLIRIEMDGDYQKPDRYRMTVNTSMGEEKLPSVEVIWIGEAVYVLDPETNRWVIPEEFESGDSDISLTGLDNFADSIIQMVNAFQVTEMLENEGVNGTLCYHLKGTIESTELEDLEMDLSMYDSDVLETDIWIGKDDFLIRRMTTAGTLGSGTGGDETLEQAARIALTYELSHFNEPVTIEAP